MLKPARVSVCMVIVALAALAASAQTGLPIGPEAFTADAQVTTDIGVANSTLDIQLAAYSPEHEKKAMTDALKYNGFVGFVPVFKKASVVGTVRIRERKWNIRWASQQADGDRRKILLATDEPIYFVGGGKSDSKSRTAYTMAVLQFTVDKNGAGTGTMAGAARVKPNADGTAFILDDYSDEPIALKVKRADAK